MFCQHRSLIILDYYTKEKYFCRSNICYQKGIARCNKCNRMLTIKRSLKKGDSKWKII